MALAETIEFGGPRTPPGSFSSRPSCSAASSNRDPRLRLGAASVVGALLGAGLLLALPPGAFKAIIPVLVALALVLVVAGPAVNWRLAHLRTGHDDTPRPVLWWSTLRSETYGGLPPWLLRALIVVVGIVAIVKLLTS